MRKTIYSMHIGAVDNSLPNDYTDAAKWYETLPEAMAAAREAIDSGADAAEVEVQKFYEDSGDVAWDYPITFDGGAWSESEDALEEMSAIIGRF